MTVRLRVLRRREGLAHGSEFDGGGAGTREATRVTPGFSSGVGSGSRSLGNSASAGDEPGLVGDAMFGM
jgi:hypothetical protein